MAARYWHFADLGAPVVYGRQTREALCLESCAYVAPSCGLNVELHSWAAGGGWCAATGTGRDPRAYQSA